MPKLERMGGGRGGSFPEKKGIVIVGIKRAIEK